MTSKSLCFKLMKEDMKRRVWAVALSVLSLVFTLVVPVAMKSSQYLDQIAMGGVTAREKERLINNLVDYVGINGLVIAIMVGLAVVWAVSGFRYLHNSRQVDFYHSIPVKRHQLFLSSFLNGILIPGVIYLAAQLVAVCLIARTGVGKQALGSEWWQIYLLNMLYYCMLYATVVIAMMMTGNLIVALLGTGVFVGYGPSVILLIVGYRSTWFHTLFITAQEEKAWMRAVNYSSPFANYVIALGDFASAALPARRIAEAVLVTVALAVIAYSLYRIRPSEAAGKAMAFPRTQTPIKLLIAVPVSVVFGIFFYSLRSTLAWAVFGTVCGAVLTCCIMEIIYHFDFRKLFANRLHLAGCCAAGILLILAGMYDWYGYDSWLPKATDIKSASVTMGYDEDWVSYGEIKERGRYDGTMWYDWDYGSQTEYQFDHMELTDAYPVAELAKKGISTDQERRREKKDNWMTDNQPYGRYTVQFRLNNGKTVSRQYQVPIDQEMKTIREAIHDSREYKKGTYPLLQQTAADTVGVYFQQYNQVREVTLTPDERAHLLAVYQKELEELTMAVREEEIPVGTIQFRTGELDEAVRYNEEHEIGDDVSNRCFYPVYPSFARTLEALEAAGTRPVTLNGDTVSDIRVVYYWNYQGEGDGEKAIQHYSGYEEHVTVYDEKKDIEPLAAALVFRDYGNMNSYYEVDHADNADVYVTVNFDLDQKAENRGNINNFQIDLRRLSEEEIQRFKLEREPSRDLSY